MKVESVLRIPEEKISLQEFLRPSPPTASIPGSLNLGFLNMISYSRSVLMKKTAQIGLLGTIIAALLCFLNIGIFNAIMAAQFSEGFSVNLTNINGTLSQDLTGIYASMDIVLSILFCLIITCGMEVIAYIALFYGTLMKSQRTINIWIACTLSWIALYVSAIIGFIIFNKEKMIILMMAYPAVVAQDFMFIAVIFVTRHYKLLLKKNERIVVRIAVNKASMDNEEK